MIGEQSNLVSIVIPCYNHAQYLGEAIESALNQTHLSREVIVVNDGSTDDSAQVAARYHEVRCINQTNQGLPAALNKGLHASRGAYLVFLDADDRLLPDALESNLACLSEHPTSVFVFGRSRHIAPDGTPIGQESDACLDKDSANDFYESLLRFNIIGMHATVMYRREIFQMVGDFDATLAACEDYQIYLRIARRFPVACHHNLIAEYRQHDDNMSGNPGRMLKYALKVLRAQRPHIKGNTRYERAYRQGVTNWQDYYGEQIVQRIRRRIRRQRKGDIISKDSPSLARDFLALLRYHPKAIPIQILRKIQNYAFM